MRVTIEVVVLMVIAFSTYASPACGMGAFNEGSGVSLTLLNPAERIIPLYYQNGDYWVTNLKLPVILVRNTGGSDVQLERITIKGYAGEGMVVEHRYDQGQVGACIAETAEKLNGLLDDPADIQNTDRLYRIYGRPSIMEAGYGDSTTMTLKGYLAVDLSIMSILTYEGQVKLDRIAVEIITSIGECSLQLACEDYANAGEYGFPVAGPCLAGSVPAGTSHRFANAQEFAIDILDIRRFTTGEFSSCSVPNETVVMGSDNAMDYYIYGREVMAIGDGIVLQAEDGFPDELAMNPQDFFVPRIDRLTPDLLENGVSLANIKAGNFIVIDHGNGEYSRYCHLRSDLRVKPGETVLKGQIIGTVGNSGNSMEPHLHLELLDSPDIAGANGLPVQFDRLDLINALDSPNLGEKNSLVYSEFVFINVD